MEYLNSSSAQHVGASRRLGMLLSMSATPTLTPVRNTARAPRRVSPQHVPPRWVSPIYNLPFQGAVSLSLSPSPSPSPSLFPSLSRSLFLWVPVWWC
eukprot:270328-Rhodomonas_salina.5